MSSKKLNNHSSFLKIPSWKRNCSFICRSDFDF